MSCRILTTAQGLQFRCMCGTTSTLAMLRVPPDLQDPHDSCTNNLHTSLAALGWKLTDDPDTYLTPGPFNL